MTAPASTEEMGRLSEERAWDLVRAVATATATDADAGGAPKSYEEEGATLDLGDDGSWTTRPEPSVEARDLLDLYLPLVTSGGVVLAQLAQSLDGRIATETGHSHYVTGPEDIRRLHRVRALVDAVIVGAETVASDDPRLTVREARGPNPTRVVLDPDGRLDPGRRVFTDGAAPTLVVRAEEGSDEEGSDGKGPDEGRANGSSEVFGDAAGIEIIRLPAPPPHGFDPAAVLDALRARGLQRVLVEGGGVTVSRFLSAGVLDRLHLTMAPLLIGSGRPGLTLEPVQHLDQAIRPRCRHFPLGRDLLFDLDLRAPELAEPDA